MIYYIYHIPGKKIGCTRNIQYRVVIQQGYTEYEILEEHTDIYEASNRELELQAEYGLPIDDVPYWQTIEFQRKGQTYEARSKRSQSMKGNNNAKGSLGTPKPGTSAYHKGRPKSEEHKIKIGLGNRGKTLSTETKLKISESISRNPKQLCEHCGNSWDPRNFSRWHGDNCKKKRANRS